MGATAAARQPKLSPALAEFAREVREGLSQRQKQLPSKYFYDDLGSALFEAITYLPEYGLTRADERVIRQLAPGLPELVGQNAAIAELGCGSGKKTRHVLEAFAGWGRPIYMPIDVSAAALEVCRKELQDSAEVVGFQGQYLDGLRAVASRRPDDAPLLLLFLGSNLGNFDRASGDAFLREVRGCLKHGDALLLGTDLVKPADVLIPAYADPVGVTAAFNLNLLARVNRELEGEFNLAAFAHEARYDAGSHRVEMHIRSLEDQTVHIGLASFTAGFAAGETIWTEASHKFSYDELPEMAEAAGFEQTACWVDEEWPFAESLWLVR